MIHGVWESKDIPAGADIALNPPRFERGMTYPNEGPGFGIELNETFLKRHATKDKQPRRVSL
jgi:L-alanine-DL-glutamate epimerase-like enolase superfamily enzyme